MTVITIRQVNRPHCFSIDNGENDFDNEMEKETAREEDRERGGGGRGCFN